MGISLSFPARYKKDGKFDFEEFTSMHKQYPAVLFPAFSLQNCMMTQIGGEGWWNRKKIELSMKKEDLRSAAANKEVKEKADAYKYRDAQIRRHMGFVKYHVLPHHRKKYYEIYPLPRKYRALEAANAKVHPKLDDDDENDRSHW